MNELVVFNILDREKLISLLGALTPGTPACWGKMNAQNMIEHLVEAVEYTNGKKIAVLDVSPEEAAMKKKTHVDSDFVIPRGAKGPLPDSTLHKRFPDLQTAICNLFIELDAFEEYFKTEYRTAIHGAFGPMNYKEWLIWHGKHFMHHFKQFGLIKVS
jgi:hypothetical protein